MAPDIVTYAKKEGAYTIVADYYPVEKSPAKQLADESWLISTADTEQIVQKCREVHIDGVLAGIHEFNILQAKKVADQLSLPFYFNDDQWHVLQLKHSFRELCNRFGVPSPRTYFSGKDISCIPFNEIQYPVVLKPVDNGASIGIHFCDSEQELRDNLSDAIDASDSQTIIIESFEKGVEFTAHYVISKGIVSLACIDNRYPAAVHSGFVTTIPAARVYPCSYIDDYIESVNPHIIDLISSLKLNNAVVFIQGLYNSETRAFSVFEAGLRSAAEAPYRWLDRVNNINYMHLLVDNALSVTPDYRSELDDPHLHGKYAAIVSMITKGGKVGRIEGLEDAIKSTKSVVDWECRYHEGDDTPCGDTLRQIMIRFIMVCDNREALETDIKYLNDHVNVYDINGSDMVIKFDEKRLRDVL